MNLNELSNELRELADKIDQMTANILAPRQECGIIDALKRCRIAVGPDRYVSIDPPSFDWHALNQKITTDGWRAYDGKAHHAGKTLSEAVDALIAANAKHKAEEPAIVEKMLNDVLDPVPA